MTGGRRVSRVGRGVQSATECDAVDEVGGVPLDLPRKDDISSEERRRAAGQPYRHSSRERLKTCNWMALVSFSLESTG